jgi:acyl carrier protein
MCAYHSDSKLSGTAEDRYFASCSLHGTEAIVAGLFKVVLNRPELDLDENLFTLGVGSLQAVELITRINHTFDRHLSKAALFEHPTARKMAALLQRAANETVDAITTHSEGGEPNNT